MTLPSEVGWTPAAATSAVDATHDGFVSTFCCSLGPGSHDLAEVAWEAWRHSLLQYDGAAGAERAAAQAAVDALQSRTRFSWRIWILESTVRRAVLRAAFHAMNCP